MTVWCAGLDETTILIQTCTPNGHLYRVTNTRCRSNAINSPDEGHMAARNMYRIEINIHEKKLCVKLVICQDYSEMLHGQQNIQKPEPFLKHTETHKQKPISFLTHCGRVTQICVFNTVKLGTSASSP